MPTTRTPTPRLTRLLRSLHRRGTALRIAECGGVGLVIGAVVAIVLTTLLWLDGRSSTPAALAALVLGTIGGLAWGVFRRPSPITAAIRADAQAGGDDLLATAAFLASASATPSGPPDPFAATILSLAERRCREISPSAIVLRRLGGRAWGGITLATALSAILALLASTADPTNVEAGRTTAQKPAAVAPPPPKPLIVLAPDSPLIAPSPGRQPGEDEPRSPVEPDRSPAPATRPATNPAGGDSGNPGVATPDGGGTGAGQTKVNAPPTQPAIAAANDPRTGPGTRPGTRPAGGIGGDDNASASTTPATGRTAGASSAATVPPWQLPTWTGDVDAARRELNAGRVPAAYRDLVRDYFDVK